MSLTRAEIEEFWESWVEGHPDGGARGGGRPRAGV